MNSFILKAIVIAVLITSLLGIISCKGVQKEDEKHIAEKQNDAKFNSLADKKDAQFFVDAAEINLEQIQLGKLAQLNSIHAEVQGIGRDMENEHLNSLNELKKLAKKKEIIIPTSITQNKKDEYKNLSEKIGTEFENAFCETMLKEQKNAIKKFENASKECKEQDVRIWLSETLSIVRKNWDYALSCRAKCNKIVVSKK